MDWLKYVTDLVHFALGFVAAKLGVLLPVTIAFVGYELMDAYIQLRVEETLARVEGEATVSAWIEAAQMMLGEKRELRKDIGVFLIGALLAELLSL